MSMPTSGPTGEAMRSTPTLPEAFAPLHDELAAVGVHGTPR